MKRTVLVAVLAGLAGVAGADEGGRREHRLLATGSTSTMERELNQAAFDGYRFAAIHAGETAFGGRELVTIAERDPDETIWHRYDYLVLATSRTSTMERELNAAAADGFRLVGQTVFETAFGGAEVIAVMERDINGTDPTWEYALLATNRTSTMERELNQAGRAGFVTRGVSVGVTAFGGPEVVTILERARSVAP